MSALPTRISDGLERWTQPVLDAIQVISAREPKETGSLEAMLWYQIDSGGKRLRPLIAILGAEALGGDPSLAVNAAAGIELLHNATLIHDDFQDGDTVRRGAPTVWKAFGWEQSINAGDGLYFVGMELIARSALPGDRVARLCERAANRLAQVVRGQVDEFRLKERFLAGSGAVGVSQRPITESEYLHVIRGKTAGLFSLPLETAALVAGVSDAERGLLAMAGETLGLLFQIQDDLLDLIGQKGRDKVGTDIAEGKPSLPVVRALETARPADAARLLEIVRKPRVDTTDAEISEAIGILESCGAIAYGFERVASLAAEVRSAKTAAAPLLDDLITAILAPIAHRLPG
ncbi:MAG: polyprenyl synthetase family protein [Myxococcales bacterium]|nr:polyprenyl synthetase family protein [Myxococcales bacterium]